VKAIFLGKAKPKVIAGLGYLVEQDVDVTCVVTKPGSLADAASSLGIPVLDDRSIYDALDPQSDRHDLVSDTDIGISYLYPYRIRDPLIHHPRLGCINFHPAPLPEFRGVSGYMFGLYEGLDTWGVSAHFIDQSIDTGDLISVRRFPIDPDSDTAIGVEDLSQQHLYELFTSTIDHLVSGQDLPREPQSVGSGGYRSHADMEALKAVTLDDDPVDIARKIRAFWIPPYHGAHLDIGGQRFTVVDEKVLSEIADLYEEARGYPRLNSKPGTNTG
jgi:methionyl-tRNA formyltransferase